MLPLLVLTVCFWLLLQVDAEDAHAVSVDVSLQMCMLTRTHVPLCYLQGIARVVFTHACQSFVPFCNMCVTKRWWEWVRANVRVSAKT